MGLAIDVSKVPVTDSSMQPFEIMVSESQERMLAVCTPERLDEVLAVCAKWDLLSNVIGEVTDTGTFVVKMGEEVHAGIPARSLADDAPEYDPEYREPAYIAELAARDIDGLDHPTSVDALNQAALNLIASPNIASRQFIAEESDTKGDEFKKGRTVIGPGSDAGLIAIKDSKRGVAASCDCNGRYVYLNPRRGAAIAVAESARNVSCVGAAPAALTDCLNFGSPEDPEVYWTFVESIEGISESCRALKVPVVSGNVSFYNAKGGAPIYPTPSIGLVGLIDDVDLSCTSDFKAAGDTIVLIGETLNELGGSEYLQTQFGVVAGEIPNLDLDLESRVQVAVRTLIDRGLLSSAHDCSDGGLAVTLIESAVGGGLGFDLALDDDLPAVASLFSETQSRVVVSCNTDALEAVLDELEAADLPFAVLGEVGGGSMTIKDKLELSLGDAATLWANSLEKALTEKAPTA
jgi:phosphoribosylformylglycinamidine synthase